MSKLTRYRLAVEDIEPNRWIAWVLDLPGCFSPAETEADAVARAADCIRDFGPWLRIHDSSLPELKTPVEARVVETFRSFPSEEDPDYIVNAFFEDDRRSLTYWEIETGLRLLQWTREDLLAEVEGITGEQLRASLPGEIGGSLGGVLKHVAGAENWYLRQVGLAVAREQLPEDPFSMLEVVRTNMRARLAELLGDERVLKGDGGEQWSGRKVLRRALWHERAHTRHVKRLLERIENR